MSCNAPVRLTSNASVELMQPIFRAREASRGAIGVFCDLSKARHYIGSNANVCKPLSLFRSVDGAKGGGGKSSPTSGRARGGRGRRSGGDLMRACICQQMIELQHDLYTVQPSLVILAEMSSRRERTTPSRAPRRRRSALSAKGAWGRVATPYRSERRRLSVRRKQTVRPPQQSVTTPAGALFATVRDLWTDE
ncbi:hypothetical protein EVAR_38718_1 [Eumeta japonica]|uniref:Uncharacterized protein n=1 Tax=Eumeta variegata TaxID=151549 RepID=A0A4C1YPS5_EUMVA|nr:hypothetical protein EVAR_38718_1 [Eumeta japonica]